MFFGGSLPVLFIAIQRSTRFRPTNPPKWSTSRPKAKKTYNLINRAKLMFKPKQKSTLAGLGLIGGAVAMATTGNADIITVDVTDTGYQIGGLVPAIYTLATGVIGFVLGMFDEDKKA
uniref:Uncharacterized protein n=8 Tax=Vibrionaceae TaxID=641 RepID=A0A0H4A4G6_9VIBR|nr:hypothetical protein [Vibrio splendidus]AKN38759.1 hypothetical protein [Enterovibrio norvegicus]AKN38941.1 hypothetical protein [Aliivibrio fischeri]AKN39148.1 hypothetical protein [Vibrio kanaloae]AKN39933.1 hypothetical protein [Vibrio sp. FF_307]AKN40055.1 hypothetical protein [Vibrio tasmaniensis]